MMNPVDPVSLTVREASGLLSSGSASSRELCEMFLARAEKTEPAVRALLSLDRDLILRQADQSDARRRDGRALGPLDGVPVTLKDNICAQGQPCTCASKILENFRAPYDAFVTGRLKNAGCVLFGRANMDEFAMGSSCENSAFQKTANPWDTARVPGGSSGGSAAAVASGITCAALGSDTGGSIRQPASFCGIVGMKPTYGRVSRNGLVAFASSLDQIGPMTKSVFDSALLFDVIAGYDSKDTTSLPLEAGGCAEDLAGYEKAMNLKGVRIGLPKEYLSMEGAAPGVLDVCARALESLKNAGAELCDISLPHTEYAMSCYYIIATAEASSNLARFDGVRYGYRSEHAKDINSLYFASRGEGFGHEVKRRIMLGTHVLSSGHYDAYYLRAQKVRTLLRRDFEEAYRHCDVIFTPASPTSAFRFGEKADPKVMYLSDIFTIALNLSGECGISVPAGLDENGLPVGIQFMAPAFEEKRLFRIARAFEEIRPVRTFRAPL